MTQGDMNNYERRQLKFETEQLFSFTGSCDLIIGKRITEHTC